MACSWFSYRNEIIHPIFELLLSNQGWLSSLITKLCTRGLKLKEVISGLKKYQRMHHGWKSTKEVS